MGMKQAFVRRYPQPSDRPADQLRAYSGKTGGTNGIFCRAGDYLVQLTPQQTPAQGSVNFTMPGCNHACRARLAWFGQPVDAPLQSSAGGKRIGHNVLIMFQFCSTKQAPNCLRQTRATRAKRDPMLRARGAAPASAAFRIPPAACNEITRAAQRYLAAVISISLENGAPGTIRTSDPQIRSLVLYPAELRARIGAGPIGMPRALGNSYPCAPSGSASPNSFAPRRTSNGGRSSIPISAGRNQPISAPSSSAVGSPAQSRTL